MLKRLLLTLSFFISFVSFAQDYSALWKGHFSYLNIKDVTQSNTKVYAAAENAVFTFDIATNQLAELSTINGLSGGKISTIYYSQTYELLMIGYESGLIEIVFDNDSQVLSVVDILDKTTIPQDSKGINHFNAHNNSVYIATNYGVSEFNLERLEFGDTFFIGALGAQVKVNQTAVFKNYIYAACSGGNGIKRGSLLDVNLIDYNNWETIATGSFVNIATQENTLYAIRSDRYIFKVENTLVSPALNRFSRIPTDVRVVDNKLLVTLNDNVYIYDADFNLVSQTAVPENFITSYTATTLVANNLFIGTQAYGVLKTTITNATVFEEIHPDGPLLNTPFRVKTQSNDVWVTFGEYSVWYNPYTYGGPHRRGLSRLNGEEWINLPYKDMLEARSLNAISINPENSNQIYVSSFYDGLLQVDENIPTEIYNIDNSALERILIPGYKAIDIRVGASVFDSSGLLWVTQGQVEHQLKSYNPSTNQWQIYALNSIVSEPTKNSGFSDITIDDNQTKWLASSNFGVIAFNENGSTPLVKAINADSQNVPVPYTTAIALDRGNQLWIGTQRGLRVLYNTTNFFEDDNIRVNEIIIEDNGVASELLYEQFISDIKVDGANNKWIGTTDSGLFYVSANGQRTIYHFTTNNSPLPSNTIQDISINETNGTVYIATTSGLVSFKSGSSKPNKSLDKAYVYPNPVRPQFNVVDKKVTIKDLSENVNIKITDIEGNLVAEAQTNINQRHKGYNLEIDGGTAYWNGKNLVNNVVASGVYLIMIADLDSYQTKVLKLMVVR